MKSKMKAFIAFSAVIVCLVYLLSHTETASAAKGPKVTDKVENQAMLSCVRMLGFGKPFSSVLLYTLFALY